MKKVRRSFVCRECGQLHIRWSGRCEGCGGWNSLAEESVASGPRDDRAVVRAQSLAEVDPEESARIATGISEFDRVLGGGLVPGAAVLVGGDPGVGKSTLLLEVAAHRAGAGGSPLYVTAEESAGQVALRAERLGLVRERVMVLAEDRVERIIDLLLDDPPDLLIVDSIQTIRKSELGSAAGTVSQVRECAADLVAAARRSGTPLVLVGHVTKDGTLAGPRVLEHLVDAVLYFEGEPDTSLRILRSMKNRHGASGEVAVFAMTERGLVDPAQPGALFLGASGASPGSVVTATVEGSRVFLVEIQALTAPAMWGPPRIRANGVDPGRAGMLAAVLNRRAGLPLGDQDIHVNVAGGFRLSDPGCDLAICIAIATSFLDRAGPTSTVAFGEVGLGGEVRPVRNPAGRTREAAALGFQRVFGPRGDESEIAGVQRLRLGSVQQILDLI